MLENSAAYRETGRISTHVYMAPEVIRGRSTADGLENIEYRKTGDIYSLALILHELFGGGSNFYPKERHPQLIISKYSDEAPQLKLESLPASLRIKIRDGVSHDPQKRPRLGEFSEAIKASSNDRQETHQKHGLLDNYQCTTRTSVSNNVKLSACNIGKPPVAEQESSLLEPKIPLPETHGSKCQQHSMRELRNRHKYSSEDSFFKLEVIPKLQSSVNALLQQDLQDMEVSVHGPLTSLSSGMETFFHCFVFLRSCNQDSWNGILFEYNHLKEDDAETVVFTAATARLEETAEQLQALSSVDPSSIKKCVILHRSPETFAQEPASQVKTEKQQTQRSQYRNSVTQTLHWPIPEEVLLNFMKSLLMNPSNQMLTESGKLNLMVTLAQLEFGNEIVECEDSAVLKGKASLESIFAEKAVNEMLKKVSRKKWLICGGYGTGKKLLVLLILQKLAEEGRIGRQTRSRFHHKAAVFIPSSCQLLAVWFRENLIKHGLSEMVDVHLVHDLSKDLVPSCLGNSSYSAVLFHPLEQFHCWPIDSYLEERIPPKALFVGIVNPEAMVTADARKSVLAFVNAFNKQLKITYLGKILLRSNLVARFHQKCLGSDLYAKVPSRFHSALSPIPSAPCDKPGNVFYLLTPECSEKTIADTIFRILSELHIKEESMCVVVGPGAQIEKEKLQNELFRSNQYGARKYQRKDAVLHVTRAPVLVEGAVLPGMVDALHESLYTNNSFTAAIGRIFEELLQHISSELLNQTAAVCLEDELEKFKVVCVRARKMLGEQKQELLKNGPSNLKLACALVEYLLEHAGDSTDLGDVAYKLCCWKDLVKYHTFLSVLDLGSMEGYDVPVVLAVFDPIAAGGHTYAQEL